MDRPIALFRDGAGAARAVVDRCPHRNAPLSLGKVSGDGCLECPYHGWRFDGSGTCTAVPGLLAGDAAAGTARNVASYATCERDGFVWIWGQVATAPTREPFPLPVHAGRAGEVVFATDLHGTLHAALENTLDVPHTAFLHRGLFRGTREKELTATRRELDDGVEVRFDGEPVGLGPIQGGPLAKKVFEHWDRFFLPGIAQVEYKVEDWLRITNTVLHLPLSPTRTRAWFVFRWNVPVPAAVLRPYVAAQGRFVLRQDARMLRRQLEQVDRFGGEHFASTELDLLGAAIWRLLRRAERAGAVSDQPADGAADEDDVADLTLRFRA
jgi:phenylpropionate dioxygenase-like ring-hydroxylating dioxygenase large terminal subunit